MKQKWMVVVIGLYFVISIIVMTVYMFHQQTQNSDSNETEYVLLDSYVLPGTRVSIDEDGQVYKDKTALLELEQLGHLNYDFSPYDDEYFQTKSLIIFGFLHSSDEKNITLLGLKYNHRSLIMHYSIESNDGPHDADIWTKIFLVEINKPLVAEVENIELEITNLVQPNKPITAYYDLSK